MLYVVRDLGDFGDLAASKISLVLPKIEYFS